MANSRDGSDMSSNDDEVPPTLFVQPTTAKRSVQVSLQAKRLRPQRSPSPSAVARRQFAPRVVEKDELSLIYAPSGWLPPTNNVVPFNQHGGHIPREEGFNNKTQDKYDVFSSPPRSPVPSTPKKVDRRPMPLVQKPSSPGASRASPSSRTGSPKVSKSPQRPHQLAAHKTLLAARPIPNLSAAPENGNGRISPPLASELESVPDLRAVPEELRAISTSPLGAERSPEKPLPVPSPQRPHTLQMHQMLAQGLSGNENGNGLQDLAEDIAKFVEELDTSLAPPPDPEDTWLRTPESIEATVLWPAVKDLHTRGRELLAQLQIHRQERLPKDQLNEGLEGFEALELRGVEEAIIKREKERAETLGLELAAMQSLNNAIDDRLRMLKNQERQAVKLEEELWNLAQDEEDVDALEVQVAAEEAEVKTLEDEIDKEEADCQAQRNGLVALIAENKAGLNQVSEWLLDGRLSECEREAKQASAASKQQLEEVQHELKLSITLSDDKFAYLAAEFLGVTIDLASGSLKFGLRHTGTPVYDHFFRLVLTSTAPLRERLLMWQEGLAIQKAFNALARFGVSKFESVDEKLLYTQRLHQPFGKLSVILDGRVPHVEATIHDGAEEGSGAVKHDSDFDEKPELPTLSSVLRRLQAFRARGSV